MISSKVRVKNFAQLTTQLSAFTKKTDNLLSKLKTNPVTGTNWKRKML